MNEIRGKVKELSHDNSSPKTEKAVCLTLEKKGFVEGEHFFNRSVYIIFLSARVINIKWI